ncbi:ribulose-phosphate 3-epimerase [candidate division WOR-3 bacterium]|nr:ribulose-phosphate 3-epimerase [candidate division WOR-3 bacterium]
MIKIGASLISSDLMNLGEVIRKLESAGLDFIHFDVMDGHFVPNLTFGPEMARAIRKISKLPLDIHLMTDEPQKTARWFIDSRPEYLSWHIETPADHLGIISFLRENKVKPGMALNPSTDVQKLMPFLDFLDFVLLMSVNPGFGGQKFIPEVAQKAVEISKKKKLELFIDGGINDKTAPVALRAGITNLVSGSYLVQSQDYSETMKKLKNF